MVGSATADRAAGSGRREMIGRWGGEVRMEGRAGEDGGQRQEVITGSGTADVNISGLLRVVLSLGFSQSLSQ